MDERGSRDRPPRLRIRAARPKDAEALAGLNTQLGYPATALEVARRLAALAGRRDCAVLVAEESDAVIAWTQVVRRETLASDPFAELAGLVVDAGHRNRRVGRRLLAAAERWAAERGMRALRVRSNVIRADAHRFYERLDYVRVKAQAIFSKDLTSGRSADSDPSDRDGEHPSPA